MAVEKDLELLDDYLTNRLGGEEKAAFEKKLEADSNLKSEYNLQQQLVEGIKKARIAQLKTIMSNTPVPPLNGIETTMLAKVGIGIFVSAVVGTGIYLYNQKDNKSVTPEQTIIIAEKKKEIEPRTETPTVTAPPQQTEERTVVEKTVSRKEQNKAAEKVKTPTSDLATTSSAKVNQPRLEVFDPSTEPTQTNSKTATPAEIKTEKTTEPAAPSIVVETDASNSKYSFHYQFKKSKLLLYGSFEKNLYEIMEFFTDNKRTIFLFYKTNYYLLNDENERIKPLTPINDPVLLKKLKEYHGN